MLKKVAVTAAAVALVMSPLAANAAAAPLPCAGGYSCDNTDPGPVSWEKTQTDAHATDRGCGEVELRSGKKNGRWYAWARVKVASMCGTYEGWIDRSYDGGEHMEHVLGYFTAADFQGSDFGNMYYWPDGAWIRAGFKRPGEDWSKSGLTEWRR
ncbi:hypothetical protein IPZ58_32590 [Streptomyces roseoverticillatus]|uniref:hypothetical protein n=1 Tax=Streptomyces roseoverticillatus TaxID=66429 RepID=UPI001F159F68|nr:hypothetical protein [Streptomyces roseoverticillatus]MCF3106276.1 hypothetical protein [Streptomyces roseoverticillatus]